ncbi:MAG: hypothetical protein Q8O92_02225 [Candidatus Latescibacter sp.]|nr:hypothetical protein [Candidatus Latescibacter sp.]
MKTSTLPTKTETIMEDKTIPRQSVHVIITLSDSRNLSGEIQIDLDSRLSDFMNKPERFLILRDKDNSLKIVNKDHIIEVIELL